jgi:2-oxoglutarate ferredoxin oxidoreductase subunit beta
MMRWQKENAVTVEQAAKMTPEQLRGKLVIGLLHHVQYPEFTYQYAELIRHLAEEREANE